MSAKYLPLLTAVTATGYGVARDGYAGNNDLNFSNYAIEVSIKGTSGTVTASVDVYGSSDQNGITGLSPSGAAKTYLGTVTLSGTGVGVLSSSAVADSGGFGVAPRYPWLIANVTAISGTGAAVTCTGAFTG